MKKAIGILLVLSLIFSLTLMLAFSEGAEATETATGTVTVIDGSIVFAILIGAVAIGAFFGYWLVKNKK